jgi:siderophore synthetase component
VPSGGAVHSIRSGCEQSQQGSPYFDHLIGEREQLCGHVDGESPGGLQLDDQIEFRPLHDWQIRRLLTLEYLADIDATQAISIREARGIAQETSFAVRIQHRHEIGWSFLKEIAWGKCR